jgi:type IV secretory pathway protease TraF
MRISFRFAILTLCLLAVSIAAAAAPSATPATPFNAQNSNQVYQKSTSGGIHQILANDPKDKALVAAIRSYVEAEAARFGTGDYGKGTPGIAYLNAIKPGHLHVVYRQLLTGAAVDYIGEDGPTVDAIHKWLDAELDAQD